MSMGSFKLARLHLILKKKLGIVSAQMRTRHYTTRIMIISKDADTKDLEDIFISVYEM